MALSTQPYKGARDFYPNDKRLQKYLFNKLRKTVEAFGYEEYDAPILEPLDIYLAKSGQEIVSEQTYTFTDRGDRQVAIRPEMTPTVSRMVAAKRQELSYPLRWYSIPNLWRYERPQRGRFREHWQLNVDMFGDESLNAELEMINLADQIYKDFGADRSMYQIKLNSRKLVDQITSEQLELDGDQSYKLAKLIDRRPKLEASSFNDQALEILGEETKRAKLVAILDAPSLDNLPDDLKHSDHVKDLAELINKLKTDLGIDNVVYDPNLMRGFDYYDNIVFEIFDVHPDNNRSMMGGGRYDGLVGLFGVEPLPTIGFGLGDATLYNFLELHDLLPKLKPETDLAILVIASDQTKALGVINQIRSKGLNVAVESSDRKLGNKIKWAENKGLQHVLVLGDQELESTEFNIKDINSGEESKVNLDNIHDFFKK
jgi:histidyl-tRNA synthetase